MRVCVCGFFIVLLRHTHRETHRTICNFLIKFRFYYDERVSSFVCLKKSMSVLTERIICSIINSGPISEVEKRIKTMKKIKNKFFLLLFSFSTPHQIEALFLFYLYEVCSNIRHIKLSVFSFFSYSKKSTESSRSIIKD